MRWAKGEAMSDTTTEPLPAPTRPSQRRFAWFVSACVILELALLIFAWALPFRSATSSLVYHYVAPISFFMRVFQLHAGFLALIACVVLFMLKSKKMAALALLTAIIGIAPEAWLAYGPRGSVAISDGVPLKVASINLLRSLQDVDAAAKVIESFDADVVSVQEITPAHDAVLTPRLASRYPYSIVKPDEGFRGLAIYSRYPVTLEEDGVPLGLRWLRAGLQVDGQEIAFYAIHLAPPQAFNMQRTNRWQVGRLRQAAADEKRPTILAGDFNFSALTPQARALRRSGFVDAHFASTRGRGTSWGAAIIPEVRIDTVYIKGDIAAEASEVGPRFGSDHKPIVVDLWLK
jgi:endonuclease/exonuclease/phosphatase (EEP) superfamily protein YafD